MVGQQVFQYNARLTIATHRSTQNTIDELNKKPTWMNKNDWNTRGTPVYH